MTEPVPNASPEPTLWRMLWPRIKPYRWFVLLAVVLNAVHGIAISYQTLMTKYLIDDVILSTNLTSGARWKAFWVIILTYLAVSLFGRMAAWHIGFRFFTYTRERVVMALRLSFFSHVNHLCLRFHKQYKSGELFNYLFGSTLGQIQGFFHQFTMNVPGAVFTLLSTIIMVARWDWAMTLVLCITVLSTVLVLRFSRKTVRQITRDFQKTETAVSGYVADLLRGARDVKIFAIEKEVQNDFSGQIDQIRRQSYTRDIKSHMQWMKQETIGYFCFAFLCLIGVMRYLDQRITIGEFQGYLAAFIALQGPLQTLFNIGTQKIGAQTSMERLDTIMRTVSSTPDPEVPVSPVPTRGTICIKNLNFNYENRSILRDLTLTVPYGQHVALVGPSGGGKTTFVQLLLRLHEATGGSICLDDTDIRRFKGAELRKLFGVVPQDPFIFSTTLLENLRIVAPAATREEIIQACRQANAWEFIEKMEKQLESPIGESGSTLSGGQKQRLAIARALLSNPSYFILDEATSALDTLSEQLIQESVETAMRGRTAFIIAHRLATVRNCDRILVLHEGVVVQDGTYEALSSQPGLFADLVAGQQLRTSRVP